MARNDKIGAHKTSIKVTKDGATVVTYHDTDVVTITDETITLNTGEWFTVTAKARMNQVSNELGLGYRVYREGGAWYVDYAGKIEKFNESVLILKR